MFYSTDPASDWGFVLTPDGHTVPKESADDADSSTTHRASATDGTSLVWPLALSALAGRGYS